MRVLLYMSGKKKIHNNKQKSNSMCRFLKVLMAAFIMSLSICSLSEAAWLKDPRVPELEQQVRELSLTIDTQKEVINDLREELDNKNKIIEQQSTRIEEQDKIIEQRNARIDAQDATIRALMEKKKGPIFFCVMGGFTFICGTLFGTVLLFRGLQRRCNK